ncbi:MAG: ABC transporter ATP-binding protein [Acidimicrobiaceae bacterium]|nr:ABC transporter ATP-binding protein [Acidimicrobiaceae bacterium]MCY3643800.1 ABC transporter ATP-binding protein [Acidimicrobiaceae bacterium]MDE0493297.1 ABC transporter ATP-binding protein [Acidimicrobiaceae bacterium]MXW88674.1 ABC transporter ATP-binding protein [Acidimicrobiaceae bacterium]MXY10195.1 ABC transporter ATP-binding protein [Acidimicrobiaceae bacterium]
MTPILELRDVEAGYGPFRALFGVSLAVEAAEAVALVGANGAGKTTLARVASGLVAPSAGTVLVDGEEIGSGRPSAWRFVRAGVAHAPEGRSVFASLTVEENLALSFHRAFGRAGLAGALDRAYELFPRLGERRTQVAGTLSGGEQRMLSLARVLVESPRLLIADELSLGLAPMIVDQVFETLGRIRAAGTALLIVEQQVGHALELCDRAAVMEHGLITWQGPSNEAGAVLESRLFETGAAR